MNGEQFVTSLCSRLAAGLVENETSLGYIPDVRWPNTTAKSRPDPIKLRIALSYQNSLTKQTTLGQPARYTTTGLFTAQIYAPSGVPENNKKLVQLADAIAAFYIGVSEPGGVWYRDVSVRQLPAAADYFTSRVTGKYTYEGYLTTSEPSELYIIRNLAGDIIFQGYGRVVP